MSEGEVGPGFEIVDGEFDQLDGKGVPPGAGGGRAGPTAPRGSAEEWGDGSASLRHDLAGPLTAILGTAELLLLKGQNLPREARDSLGQILDNCGRISEILARGPTGGPAGHEGRATHRPKEH